MLRGARRGTVRACAARRPRHYIYVGPTPVLRLQGALYDGGKLSALYTNEYNPYREEAATRAW
jgi:hypothetical protein